MSSEYEAALEICGKLDQLREEMEWSTTGPGRRERIATAAMQGYLAMYGYDGIECPSAKDAAERAVSYADALIDELDKPTSPDPRAVDPDHPMNLPKSKGTP